MARGRGAPQRRPEPGIRCPGGGVARPAVGGRPSRRALGKGGCGAPESARAAECSGPDPSEAGRRGAQGARADATAASRSEKASLKKIFFLPGAVGGPVGAPAVGSPPHPVPTEHGRGTGITVLGENREVTAAVLGQTPPKPRSSVRGLRRRGSPSDTTEGAVLRQAPRKARSSIRGLGRRGPPSATTETTRRATVQNKKPQATSSI